MQKIIAAISDSQDHDSIRKTVDKIAAKQRTELQTLVAALIQHDSKFQSLEKKSQDVLCGLLKLNTGTTSHIDKRFDELHSQLESRDQKILSSLRSFRTESVQKDNQLKSSRVSLCFLDSLRFDKIEMRHSAIAREHAQTCEWVFKDSSATKPWSLFTKWLRDDAGIYWVNGKAGSGKSTLMKFIWNHPRTTRLLTEWAGNSSLACAAFFFWNSGEKIQSTQEGLFRSLLYQLCRHHPEFLHKAFPDEWETLSDKASCDLKIDEAAPKSLEELKDAFEKVAACASQDLRMCIFIDGFDETEGEIMDITDFIVQVASSSPYIKICISSRPWPVFETSFHGQPSLKMQDLNGDDIRRFTLDKLGRDPNVRNLLGPEPGKAEWLIKEVVSRACGVFLWVYLVVKLLIKGIRDGDDTMTLYNRLLSLPGDLELLFQRIIGQIEPNHQAEASQIFQIFRANGNKLDILTMHRALMYTPPHTPDQALKLKVMPSTAFKTPQHHTLLKALVAREIRRLNSRCRGLLEVNDGTEEDPVVMSMAELEQLDWLPKYPMYAQSYQNPGKSSPVYQNTNSTAMPDVIPQLQIRYLHRTARDYLEQPQIWSQILSMSASFDPNTVLLAAYVNAVKMSHQERKFSTVLSRGTPRLFSAVYLENLDLKPSMAHVNLIDDLDRASAARRMEDDLEKLGLRASEEQFVRAWETDEPSHEFRVTDGTVWQQHEVVSTLPITLLWYHPLKKAGEKDSSVVCLTDRQGLPLAFSAIAKRIGIPPFLAMALSWLDWTAWLNISVGSTVTDYSTVASEIHPGAISLVHSVVSTPGFGPDSYRFRGHTLWEYVVTLVHNLSNSYRYLDDPNLYPDYLSSSVTLRQWFLIFEIMLEGGADPCASCIHDSREFIDAISISRNWVAPEAVINHMVVQREGLASAVYDEGQWSPSSRCRDHHSVGAVVRDVFVERRASGAEGLLSLVRKKKRMREDLNVERQDDADSDGGGVNYPHRPH